MARLQSKAGTRLAVDVDPELLTAVKAAVKETRGTLAGFTQAALANQLRNHKPVMEYVAGYRKTKGTSALGPLDAKVYRADGVPHALDHQWSKKDWQEFWRLTNLDAVISELDEMRKELSFADMTKEEWDAIVQHMNGLPGGKRV